MRMPRAKDQAGQWRALAAFDGGEDIVGEFIAHSFQWQQVFFFEEVQIARVLD